MGKVDRKKARLKRHARVRKKVFGTPERPRLCVYKSLKHTYAQIIDDVSQRTLVFVSTLSKGINVPRGDNIEAAKAVGALIGKKALEKNIRKVVFDRGGYIYHGRVKALAEAAREAGLEF